MPRSFFTLIDGANPPDPEGDEPPDPAEARRQAVRPAGEIVACPPHRPMPGEDRPLALVDDRGGVLLRFDVRADGAPDRGGPRP